MTKFHKEIFCAIDRWAGLDMNDIRRLEADIKTELDRKIATQELKPPCTAGWPFVHFYVTFLAVGTPVESVKSNPF